MTRAPAAVRWVVVTAVIAFGVVTDWATGPDISMVLFDALGVIAAGWALGAGGAVAAVIVTSLSAAAIQYSEGQDAGFSDSFVAVNGCLRAGALALFAAFGVATRRYVLTVERIAIRDPLTGTLNRRALIASLDIQMSRARRAGRPITVAFFDVDGLKAVNDVSGHGAGDELLREFATVLRGNTRPGDIIGRIGGDEFVLVLPETDAAGAGTVVERIGSRADGPRASVGLATWTPERDTGPTELIHRADIAMYEHKQRRRST